MKYDKENIVEMAKQRGRAYERIIGTLMALPDSTYLTAIRSDETQLFLKKYAALKQPSIEKGSSIIAEFLEETAGSDESVLLEKMAVDRARLIRAPFAKAYPPPYEGQYAGGTTSADQLTLKKLYQEAGYAPADEGETFDFFAMELDFLRVLNLRMEENPDRIPELIAAQLAFIDNHPGRWISQYVAQATPHADTKFYKGWLFFLEGFLELEKAYLRQVHEELDT